MIIINRVMLKINKNLRFFYGNFKPVKILEDIMNFIAFYAWHFCFTDKSLDKIGKILGE